jgi:pimeloyl-ACP methyl ester carboxylesterase
VLRSLVSVRNGGAGRRYRHWGKVPDKDRYASLKTIHQPTLVVNGKHDMLVPTINSYILQRHLPNATLIIYPGSGHGAIFQFSELFVRKAQFLLNS